MEHAPGPRGSPQAPHAPEGTLVELEPFAETANTESCGAKRLLWHSGQEAFCFPRIMASKRWPQSLQEYSKIGMLLVIPVIRIHRNLDGFYSSDLIHRR